MQSDQSDHPGKPQAFRWRAMTSVLIAASFAILLFSGIMLFVSPPGRVANWTNWTILGLRKHEWIGLHIWFSLLFLLVAFFHIFFNWRPLLNYFKDRITRRVAFRWEWVVAVAICGGVYGGTRAGVPPFSSLLAFNERVKESWDQPQQRAPIPHAELLTLAELAQKAGVELAVATNRLQAAGIKGVDPAMVVQEIADKNNRSAHQVYQMLSVESTRGEQHGGGKGGGGYGGYGGGKAGGGPGRKTLTEFCKDEGLDVAQVIARLQAKGMKATANETMREIAVNNGYSRPYELMDIIRGGGNGTKPN